MIRRFLQMVWAVIEGTGASENGMYARPRPTTHRNDEETRN